MKPWRRTIEKIKKKNPHRQVTEFKIQAGGDALGSKPLQAKRSMWLPKISSQ